MGARLVSKSNVIWAIAFVVVTGICAFKILGNDYIADNCALYLDCGKMMAKGLMPYADFIDLNPPCISILMAGLAIVGNCFALSMVPLFKVSVFLFSIFSTALTGYFLLAADKQDARATKSTWAILFALLLSPYFLSFGFGERDHLLTLGYLPYFFLRIAKAKFAALRVNPILSLIAGLLAGVAFCLKPQYILLMLVAEASRLKTTSLFVKAKDISIEVKGLLLSFALYVCYFLTLSPAAKENFAQFLMPLTMSDYTVYNVPYILSLDFFCHNGQLVTSSILAWLVVIAGLLMHRRNIYLKPLAVFTITSFLLFVVQSKGWGYQSISFYFGVLLLAAIEASIGFALIERLSKTRRAMCTALTVTGLSLLIFADTSKTGHCLDDLSDDIQMSTKPGQSVLVLASSVSPTYPVLVKTGRSNGSRYLWSAPLVMLDQKHERAEIEAARSSQQVFDQIWQDTLNSNPQVIYIETTRVSPNCPHTLLEMASMYGFLDRLESSTKYTRGERSDRYVTYHLTDLPPVGSAQVTP